MITRLSGKDFITTQDWTREELETALEVAYRLKAEFAIGMPHDHILRAKTLYMLFFEESTRTRNSFETGMTQLGGHAIFLTPKVTQLGHGESIKDTAIVLSRYGHGIAIRDCRKGIGRRHLYEVARWADVPVFSMQDDVDHPCQAMADLMTIQEKFGRNLHGLHFTISWTYAPKYVRPMSVPQALVMLMPRFGMNVTLAHPKGYELMPEVLEIAQRNAEAGGGSLRIVDDMDEAFRDAHVVYPKSWGPLMTTEDPAEVEAMAARYKDWRATAARMALAHRDAIYMHCMPVDRGHEVDDEVIDGPQSVIYDQAENRLHVQKALMALTMGGRL
ncbi:MAG TPA: ornithine carbamoyltransferase [Caldilineae bacterium]|jgi:N-acetylornithine carbamoyltransferase|nr:ornithine carbamoyltransferase [Caldilineae bacterium]